VPRSICLMGIGNVLMGDDALGPYVIDSLQASWIFSPEVAVVDAGTPGLDLALLLEDFDALVAVDAVHAAGRPGEIRTCRRAELLRSAPPASRNAHDPRLREALLRLDLLGSCPREAVLVGAIPAVLAAGIGLSEPLRRALPAIEEQVLRELLRVGARIMPMPRLPARTPWWEAAAARG
jgi:hydrogenase maturation protease